MKKYFYLILFFVAPSLFCEAQISTMQIPPSFKDCSVDIDKIPVLTLTPPDIESLLQEDIQRESMFKIQRCAVDVFLNGSFFDIAKKFSSENGNIYLLRVKIPDALALNLYSDDFFIPDGGELYLYNPEKTKILGAFTSDNNSESMEFATDYVYNDEIIMEYFQPYSVNQSAKIGIESFGYFYRNVINFEELDGEDKDIAYEFKYSGSCNVNANCSEGNNYRKPQRSVCRILIKAYDGEYWCSGTLVNNTNQDKTPYILSAAHCVEKATNSTYWNRFVFYFNYESSGCSTPATEPGYKTLTGCSVLAVDDSYSDEGTDNLLMRINASVPQSYNTYWCGWSRNTQPVNAGVGIHHPSGDIKKISVFNSYLTSSKYTNNSYTQTHWIVQWVRTTNGYGITEGGSSGSGLFSSTGKLIGTLSGGTSSCFTGEVNKRDWYGKFYLQYDDFADYLDPLGLDLLELPGMDYNEQSDLSSLSEIPLKQEAVMDFDIYPVPADKEVTVSVKNTEVDYIVSVLDNVGRVMLSDKILQGQVDKSLDISDLNSGVYFVRIYTKGQSAVKKITVK